MSIPSRRSDASHIAADVRTFFVTSSTRDKRALLQSERSAGLLLDVMQHYRKEGRYRLHEFVVMPNHFHLLLSVTAGMSVERAVQLIKGGFAYRAARELGMRSPWQKGFSEVRILDQEAYAARRRYIHENPVSRHLVENAEDYPCSSAHPGFELDPPPPALAAAKAAVS